MRKTLTVLAFVGFLSFQVQAALVDDFEGYDVGNVGDVASPPWNTSEDMYYGNIVDDGGNKVITSHGSGDYRDIRVSTPLAISTTGTLTFDVKVNAETGLDNAFGLTHNESMSWYSDYGPYVRVTTNVGGDADGLVGLDTRDGGGFVDDIALLNIGQWYTIMFDIDTAGGGDFDIYLDGSLIYSDSGFRYGYADDPLDVFCLMAASSATENNVMVDNVYITPEPTTLVILALGGLYLRRRKA